MSVERYRNIGEIALDPRGGERFLPDANNLHTVEFQLNQNRDKYIEAKKESRSVWKTLFSLGRKDNKMVKAREEYLGARNQYVAAKALEAAHTDPTFKDIDQSITGLERYHTKIAATAAEILTAEEDKFGTKELTYNDKGFKMKAFNRFYANPFLRAGIGLGLTAATAGAVVTGAPIPIIAGLIIGRGVMSAIGTEGLLHKVTDGVSGVWGARKKVSSDEVIEMDEKDRAWKAGYFYEERMRKAQTLESKKDGTERDLTNAHYNCFETTMKERLAISLKNNVGLVDLRTILDRDYTHQKKEKGLEIERKMTGWRWAAGVAVGTLVAEATFLGATAKAALNASSLPEFKPSLPKIELPQIQLQAPIYNPIERAIEGVKSWNWGPFTDPRPPVGPIGSVENSRVFLPSIAAGNIDGVLPQVVSQTPKVPFEIFGPPLDSDSFSPDGISAHVDPRLAPLPTSPHALEYYGYRDFTFDRGDWYYKDFTELEDDKVSSLYGRGQAKLYESMAGLGRDGFDPYNGEQKLKFDEFWNNNTTINDQMTRSYVEFVKTHTNTDVTFDKLNHASGATDPTLAHHFTSDDGEHLENGANIGELIKFAEPEDMDKFFKDLRAKYSLAA